MEISILHGMAGQAFSLFGSALVRFVLIWWLTSKTGSATVLALASLLTYIPVIALGPFLGALIDRSNRKTILVVSDGMVAILTAIVIYL